MKIGILANSLNQKSVSVRTKIIGLSLVPVILLSIVSGIVAFQVERISGSMTHVLENTVPALTTSKEISAEISILLKNITSAYIYKSDAEQLSSALSAIESSLERIESARERYLALQMTEKAAVLRTNADLSLTKFLSAAKDALKSLQTPETAVKIPEILQKELLPPLAQFEEVLSNIEINNADIVENEKNSSSKLVKSVRLSFIVGVTIASLISIALSLLLSKMIAGTLVQICGNLSAQSNRTRQQSSQIARASKELASSSSQSGSALQKTATAVEEMSAVIQKNTESAQESSRVSRENETLLDEGKGAINKIKASVDEIRATIEGVVQVMDTSNKRIAEILQVIGNIDQKTKVINDIVFQTKLLSFNASVEAARAGEQGKGFAVVAEEVGNLAKLSGGAAHEISEMLAGSLSRVNSIIQESQASMEAVAQEVKTRVTASEKIVETSVEFLDKIIGKSREVDVLVNAIATASVEQSTGVSEINSSMQQLDQVSNKNVAAGQEVASAAEMLQNQSEELVQIVSDLRVLVYGQNEPSSGIVNAEVTSAPV